MRTVIKLVISLFFLVSFTACFPLWESREHGGEGRWSYNNHQYESGREYRNARREGRNGDRRSDDHDNNNHRNNDYGNQGDNR